MALISNISKDLVSDMNIEQLFQKHIIDGSSYFFQEFLKEGDQEYQLRHDIAVALKININDIVIVGSAKIGFSIKDENFNKFDDKFSKTYKVSHKSDIDIAIVNKTFFDQQTALIFEMSRHFSADWIDDKWIENLYYQDERVRKGKAIDPLFQSYTKYIARGWLRPDFTPNNYINQIPWKGTVDKWFPLLNRKINVGLYSDWYYLKHYQMDHLLKLRIKMQKLEI